ncbi:MAG: acyl--CoA ligase [Firmicutes bacterium]|nr:acyl--CoA ligase [Bacillota bacterium]
MNKEQLIEYKKKLIQLTEEDSNQRDIYLSQLNNGKLKGPMLGIPSIDKPWLKYYNEKSINMSMPKMTCYDYLKECNKKYLDRTALSYFGRKITFEELFINIESTAKALKSLGLKENEVITISLPNIPEAVYLFYACSKIGVVANMVDPRSSEEDLKKYIEEVDSKLVIIVDSHFYKIKRLVDEEIVDKTVAVSPAESLPLALNLGYKAKEFVSSIKDSNKKIDYSCKVINWSSFINGGNNFMKSTEVEYVSNRPFVIEHTGGTTGSPKGVILTNENINAVALQSVLTGIDMKREHTWLDIMPTFIAYGVGMGLHLPLTIGMETILIPQFKAEEFDKLLLKHKPVHMVGVPSYWGTIINSKKMQKQNLSYMIAPTVGGDAMNIELEKAANAFLTTHGCSSKITKGYGMTEVCGGVVGTIDENNQLGSVGIPFVKINIAIFDPETQEELGYNQEGEVCITGPNTMLKYWDNEKATEDILKVHEDGTVWVHSGDIGYITNDGNLFITDRMKRLIIRYDGFKVFPSRIEKVISSYPAVESCKVIGIQDCNHSQGKLPKVHIVLKEEYREDEDIIIRELEKLCMEQLPEYMQPVAYQVRDIMPLTSVGKIDYLALEAEEIKVKTLTKNK